MSGNDMAYDRELIVIFGDESLRRQYIEKHDVDPMRVIGAIYPEILGVMQAGELVSIEVVRYPKKQWSRVCSAFDDEIADTENRLRTYKQRGMMITEISL